MLSLAAGTILLLAGIILFLSEVPMTIAARFAASHIPPVPFAGPLCRSGHHRDPRFRTPTGANNRLDDIMARQRVERRLPLGPEGFAFAARGDAPPAESTFGALWRIL